MHPSDRCTEFTLAGERCRTPATVEGRWCWRHAPPAVEVLGGPWDGLALRSWSTVVFASLDPSQPRRWRGSTNPAEASAAGELRGVYVRDQAAQVWRWERHAGAGVEEERRP